MKQAEPGLGGKIKRRGTLHQTYGVALPSGARCTEGKEKERGRKE